MVSPVSRIKTTHAMSTLALVVGLTLTSLFATNVKSDANTNVNSFICNGNTYSGEDPYGNSVAYVLALMMNETPSQQGFSYYCESPYTTAPAFGHATCGQSISSNDCDNCLAAARTFLNERCALSIGAQVQMVDCTMRFENYQFT